VYVHRVTAELTIGRYLHRGEVVHHVDGNRLNNSPDNLRVMSRGAHAEEHASKRTVAMVALLCPVCLKEFTRERRQTFLAKGRGKLGVTCCSYRCHGRFSTGGVGAENVGRNVVREFKAEARSRAARVREQCE
jgi:hypothetical protein